jgi:exopolyphosphatase/guanosine-5'-triphosphate,3'-diphosphate pyrophosphatase
MRFASIDIGSNAVRLLLCNVIEDSKDTHFKKNELIRMPIRLGEDAFLHGKITEEKIKKLVDTMKAFKYLIKVFDAVSYRACATSAMRDAKNGNEIIERIRKETGIPLEIIDGKAEAEIIYSNHIAEHLERGHSYLYIDVGGGSTQLTLFSGNKIVFSQSFNVGTIRFLHQTVTKEYWTFFKDKIKEITKNAHPLTAIGSGGNINKLFKMLRKKDNRPVYYDKLKELHEYISSFSIEERTTRLGLNPDRADVIVPAAKIFLAVMKNAGIEEMIVPQIGLSDGIVHLLYEEFKAKNAEKATA